MVAGSSFGELVANSRTIGGRKSDAAYKLIKRAIIFRTFEPGQQLREQELAGELQCSQGTIREALMHLGEDGLVRRSGYRGTNVTDISRAEAVEMVRVRLSIERAVAREIARNGLEHDRPALETLLAQMDDSHQHDDLFTSSELDRAFHARLAHAAGMTLLAPLLERCSLHIHRFTLGGLEVPRDFFQESGVGNEHRNLLAELCSGDTIRAETAMAGHLAHILGRWSPSLLEAVGAGAFTPTEQSH